MDEKRPPMRPLDPEVRARLVRALAALVFEIEREEERRKADRRFTP
jgi:hypothetical protein